MRVETIGDATLYLGDCREILPTLGRVQSVITDPPYADEAHAAGRRVLTRGRDLGRARAVDGAALPFAPLADETRRQLVARAVDGAALPFAPLADETRRQLVEWAADKCAGWLLAFCQAESVAGWRADVAAAGMRWIRAQAWIKPDSSPQLSGDRPAQGYESIATAWCGAGRSQWNGGGRRGVYVFSKHDPEYGHGGKENEHPTKKPRALMNELVALFSNEGDTVLDPFMGSGSTGVACAGLGRRFVGIEQEPAYFATACERIAAAYAQGRLFA